MPYSKLKQHIAEILQKEGYIGSWSVQDAEVGKTLTINLKYGPNRERSIAGLRRVSKPGLRVYAKSTALPRVLGGLGIAISLVAHRGGAHPFTVRASPAPQSGERVKAQAA